MGSGVFEAVLQREEGKQPQGRVEARVRAAEEGRGPVGGRQGSKLGRS